MTIRLDVKLPRYGTSMEEGTVGQWLKQVGEVVARGEALCEIETEKVAVEFESPVSGRLVEIVAATGQDLEVGGILCRIEAESDQAG